jgi:hypothetical protein
MFTRTLLYLFLLTGCLATCFGQQQTASSDRKPSGSSSSLPITQAFPLILQQNVVAGKAAPGTKIQAKLIIATLVNRTVIPKNAVFSGEVIESEAKTSTEPSRLSIRINSAQWKGGSLPIQAYLTQWYYPVTLDAGPELQYGPPQSAKRTWNGMGQYPDPGSPAYKPFPSGADSDRGSSASAPASTTSDHPVQMKDVEFERKSDGGITLISSHSNLKLEKETTYIFSSADLASSQAKQK